MNLFHLRRVQCHRHRRLPVWAGHRYHRPGSGPRPDRIDHQHLQQRRPATLANLATRTVNRAARLGLRPWPHPYHLVDKNSTTTLRTTTIDHDSAFAN